MIKLRDVASYVSEKVDIGLLKVQDYITTDNMLSNRGGIIIGNDLPKADKVTKFERGDILVSNIRPYFKKSGMQPLMEGVLMMLSFFEQMA